MCSNSTFATHEITYSGLYLRMAMNALLWHIDNFDLEFWLTTAIKIPFDFLYIQATYLLL